MKISTKGRYGLRIILDIALHQDKGPVVLRDIAKRQVISQKYLWQVITPLKSAGLLTVTRGAHGGYVLAQAPETISIRDVVGILEGQVSLVSCVTAPDSCKRSAQCTVRSAWTEIEEKLNDAMRGITLKDLIQRHKDAEPGDNLSYMI